MSTGEELASALERIDGRSYRAYKDLRGSYDFPDFRLFIDHVQGDPFAAPSKIRVRVPMRVAGLPPELSSSRVRCTALEDFLAREVRRQLPSRSERASAGSGKSGLIAIDAGGQEVLERSAVRRRSAGWVEARRRGRACPANGRGVISGRSRRGAADAHGSRRRAREGLGLEPTHSIERER